MNSIQVKYPIGLMLPITNGNISGYFDQSIDTFTAYRMNIINLIKTIPGERRMNPTFGCRLWSVVFDQHDNFLPSKIENIIKEDVLKWVPGVNVSSVTVKKIDDNSGEDYKDINKLYITVKFSISSINQSNVDVVDVVLYTNKI